VPIIRENELDIISYSAEQTHRLGARLGALLEAGDVLCLSGDMGAGKTMFASGIGKGWGAVPTLTSPTYNLVHIHKRPKDKLKLYHLDCYRLSGVMDSDSIGLDDILSGAGVVILEWPEQIETVLPKERLWVTLRVVEQTRRNLIFDGIGTRYEALLSKFRGAAFGV
jgi:tRNA threonylcarbamoyladenosine biosynthesis protein TsaE